MLFGRDVPIVFGFESSNDLAGSFHRAGVAFDDEWLIAVFQCQRNARIVGDVACFHTARGGANVACLCMNDIPYRDEMRPSIRAYCCKPDVPFGEDAFRGDQIGLHSDRFM